MRTLSLDNEDFARMLAYVSELRSAMAEKRPCVSAEPPQIVLVPWKEGD